MINKYRVLQGFLSFIFWAAAKRNVAQSNLMVEVIDHLVWLSTQPIEILSSPLYRSIGFERDGDFIHLYIKDHDAYGGAYNFDANDEIIQFLKTIRDFEGAK